MSHTACVCLSVCVSSTAVSSTGDEKSSPCRQSEVTVSPSSSLLTYTWPEDEHHTTTGPTAMGSRGSTTTGPTAMESRGTAHPGPLVGFSTVLELVWLDGRMLGAMSVNRILLLEAAIPLVLLHVGLSVPGAVVSVVTMELLVVCKTSVVPLLSPLNLFITGSPPVSWSSDVLPGTVAAIFVCRQPATVVGRCWSTLGDE